MFNLEALPAHRLSKLLMRISDLNSGPISVPEPKRKWISLKTGLFYVFFYDFQWLSGWTSNPKKSKLSGWTSRARHWDLFKWTCMVQKSIFLVWMNTNQGIWHVWTRVLAARGLVDYVNTFEARGRVPCTSMQNIRNQDSSDEVLMWKIFKTLYHPSILRSQLMGFPMMDWDHSQ